MAYLHDFLLQEIFVRLTVKSLHRFKCVSKHWLSLISDTCFVDEYVRLQSRRTNDDILYKNLYRTTFVYEMQDRPPSYLDLPSYASDQYGGLSFEFIPRQLVQRGIKLLGASHGWILCSTAISNSCSTLISIRWMPDYHLCSPVFKQWIHIPRPPKPNDKDYCLYRCEFCSVGFMCEEDNSSSCSSNTRVAVKPLEFKVFKIFNYGDVLLVMVFSSESWEWRTSRITSKPSKPRGHVLPFPLNINLLSCMVYCDGTLYWSESERCVFALDLDGDDNPLRLHYIPLPTKSAFLCRDIAQLRLCHGQIHVICWDYVWDGDTPDIIISTWKLIKEVHTDDHHHHHYQWRLKHRIRIESSHLRARNVLMVDCDPLDEEILYIVLKTKHTIGFNLKNNTMTKIQMTKLDRLIWRSVPFVVPYWPLPLKTPKLQLSKKRTAGIRINSMEPKQKKAVLSYFKTN